jgi:hypothetical protein
VLFAAEETAGGLERFAARNVDPAMGARNHRLGRGRRGSLPALACKTGQHEVDDDYCDEEKEELAHTEMAACIAARDEASLYRRGTTGRTGRETGRGDWIRTSDSCVPNSGPKSSR